MNQFGPSYTDIPAISKEIRDPGLATKAAELQKQTAQLENLVFESHRRLFGAFPSGGDSEPKSDREWPIDQIIRNCSQRIAALCGFVETMNQRMD